jgi:homoserine kinase
MQIANAAAYAPATMANLGVGFDVLGLAFNEPGDTVVAEWSDTPGVTVIAIHGDGGKLSRQPDKNTASVAAMSVLRACGETRGVALTIHKGLPLASGLGSSAASAVAAAVAVNALLGEPMSRGDLLPASLDGEAVASGYHPDNVAPCLFGGITLAYGLLASQVIKLPIPANLHLALVTPNVEVPTKEARAALPAMIPLKQMVSQTAGIARLIDAIHRGDVEAMASAMDCDCVIEPARAHLMPKLTDVRKEAMRAGALGLVISGAGPTLCAVCDDATIAREVASAMEMVYDEAGIGSVSRYTQVSEQGARVV